MIVDPQQDPESIFRRPGSPMPRGMLSLEDFKAGNFPKPAEAHIVRIEKLISSSNSDADLEVIQNLLDRLVDFPHRVVVDLFSQPDAFLRLLKTNSAVRARFGDNLGTGRRDMRWLVDSHDLESPPIDEWRGAELVLATEWVTQAERAADDILNNEDSHDGQGDANMAVTPSFENHIRQMFRDIDVEQMAFMYDFTDYEVVRVNSSNILRCLKGSDGMSVMPPSSIGGPWPVFERWIGEGHPR
jgi:hypothetical protein